MSRIAKNPVTIISGVSVDIKGLYYSHELVNETDTNFWSGAHRSMETASGESFCPRWSSGFT